MDAFQNFQTDQAWTRRLEIYADVPRRQIDLVERLLHTVAEPLVVSRELEGPPGWSVRKNGKSGRFFILIEEALKISVGDLDDRIRSHFARAEDEGDPDEAWARRVHEYACGPLRSVIEAEERLEADIGERRGWTIMRTTQGEPGWLIEPRALYYKVFVSVASLGYASVDMILEDLDRIDDGPRDEFLGDSCPLDDNNPNEDLGAKYDRVFARGKANVELIQKVAILVSGAENQADYDRTYGAEDHSIFRTAMEIVQLVRATPPPPRYFSDIVDSEIEELRERSRS